MTKGLQFKRATNELIVDFTKFKKDEDKEIRTWSWRQLKTKKLLVIKRGNVIYLIPVEDVIEGKKERIIILTKSSKLIR